jgi:UPF0755 protein
MEENKKKKRKLKRPVKIALGIITFLISAVLIGILLFNFLLGPVSNESKEVLFEVESGSSVYSVGEKLKEEGLIKNYIAYKIYVRLNGVNEYKAGIYKLDKSYSTKHIIELLTGDYYERNGITITFKEGITIRDVAKEIANQTTISESEFYAVLEDDAYIDSLIEKYWFLTDDIKSEDIYYPLEGYLFPETYTFGYNVTPEEIIEVMLDQTDKIFSKYRSLIDQSSYSIHELATLASMVESEGILDEDRKMIAGVFYNRLNAGMSLGSDVTTYYAFKVDIGERDLTSSEINTYNPYNTRGPGMAGKLPVGPISNFGESSFSAVLTPTNSDYYYFVADKSGKTHFTKTYEEHQVLINELKEAGNWIEW